MLRMDGYSADVRDARVGDDDRRSIAVPREDSTARLRLNRRGRHQPERAQPSEERMPAIDLTGNGSPRQPAGERRHISTEAFYGIGAAGSRWRVSGTALGLSFPKAASPPESLRTGTAVSYSSHAARPK